MAYPLVDLREVVDVYHQYAGRRIEEVGPLAERPTLLEEKPPIRQARQFVGESEHSIPVAQSLAEHHYEAKAEAEDADRVDQRQFFSNQIDKGRHRLVGWHQPCEDRHAEQDTTP